MNARIILKALALPLVLAATGCMHRTIIEEQVSQEPTQAPSSEATDSESAVANHPLYVRSGEAKLGEQESGPFPQPWDQRLGPFPQPWHRDGTDDGDDSEAPPPSDPNPNPDPNPKP
jgi:hypothetical protein